MRFCFLFWTLKVVVAASVLVLFTVYTHPKDVCFDIELPVRENLLIYKGLKLYERENLTHFQPGHYCIHLDMAKHGFCKEPKFTSKADELCLGQSRELTAVFAQLFTTLLADAVHILLILGIAVRHQKMTPLSIALPLFQIATIGSVFFVSAGISLSWKALWDHAGYHIAPSCPMTFNLLVFVFSLCILKSFEAYYLYRKYVDSGHNSPTIILKRDERQD